MPKEAILTMRVVVTLACLVGVPTIALVGIPHADNGPAALGVVSRSNNRHVTGATTKRSSSQRQLSVDKRAHGSGGQSPHPTGTITDVFTDLQSPNNETQVDPATFHAQTVPDPLTRHLQRLQELGASYYRLECAPNAVADFAFHCRLAGVDEPFVSNGATPTLAVEQVIRAIEVWKQTPASPRESAKSVYLR